MNKKGSALIVILFSVMLLGIILIQAWWVHESVTLAQKSFNNEVYQALNDVVKQVNRKEEFAMAEKFTGQKINEDDTIGPVFAINGENTIPKYKGYAHASVRVKIGNSGKKNMNMMLDSISKVFSAKDQDSSLQMNMQIKDLTRMINAIKTKSEEGFTLRPAEIDSMLHLQLEQSGLFAQKLSFALVKNDTSYIYKSEGFKDTAASYVVRLYPNDAFGRNIKLYAAFPDKFSEVYSGIFWASLLSLVFTIAILLLFISSIRSLLKHKKMLAVKNDFISHMTHEFKTPLAGISIGADTIAEKAGKMTLEQITKTATSIKEQSARLNKDISSVLLSALVDEKPTQILEPFNIVSSIHTTLYNFKPVLDSKAAVVKTDLEEPIMINGDRVLWEKVFSNLIDNAIKFSDGAPHIYIKATQSQGKAMIEFSDKGMGIDKEELPHIFEKFFHSASRGKQAIQGFGLGLNLVKKVVDMHSGTINVTSEPGGGTTFVIEIP